jgi:hypothetical protein
MLEATREHNIYIYILTMPVKCDADITSCYVVLDSLSRLMLPLVARLASQVSLILRDLSQTTDTRLSTRHATLSRLDGRCLAIFSAPPAALCAGVRVDTAAYVDSLGLAVTNAYGKSIFNRLVTKSRFEYKLK